MQEVLASKSPNIYDPKPTTQRPFHDDYPQGTGRPAGSRITVDIDGRPIADEAIVAGRRVGGGGDQGLSGSEAYRIADALGLSPQYTVRSGPDLKGDVGRYIGGSDKRIFIDQALQPEIAARRGQRNLALFHFPILS